MARPDIPVEAGVEQTRRVFQPQLPWQNVIFDDGFLYVFSGADDARRGEKDGSPRRCRLDPIFKLLRTISGSGFVDDLTDFSRASSPRQVSEFA